MKNPDLKNLAALKREEEGVILAIAETMAGQMRQLLFDSLKEMLGLMEKNRRPPADLQATQPDEFLTAMELAKILKISRAQAYDWIRTREIPSFSIGRTVRVRRGDLDEFIQVHMI